MSTSSQALVTLGQQLPVQSGAGVNFNSKFMTLKPYTLAINQPLTQAEGAIKGQLRITETNQQFPSLTLALLAEPKEGRQYQEGDYPNRQLICFSSDMVKPHQNAQIPQAVTCAGCPHSDWSRWTEYKEQFGKSNKELIPKCNPQYSFLAIDTETKLPLRMYIKGQNNRNAFDAGMLQIARILYSIRLRDGRAPSYHEVQFTLSTEKMKTGNNYQLKISNAKEVSAEARQAFGDFYLQFIEAKKQSAEQRLAAQQQQAVDELDAEIVGDDNPISAGGEYIEV